jgi:hypothetical protein
MAKGGGRQQEHSRSSCCVSQLVHLSCNLSGMKPLGMHAFVSTVQASIFHHIASLPSFVLLPCAIRPRSVLKSNTPIMPMTAGSSIVGIQDLPANERTGLRLESSCEVREWLESTRTESVDGKRKSSYSYERAWSSRFVASSTFKDPSSCRWSNNGGAPCVNTDPADQPWWTNDMNVASSGFYVVELVQRVLLGAFALPPDMCSMLGHQSAQLLQPILDCSKGPKHCPGGVQVQSWGAGCRVRGGGWRARLRAEGLGWGIWRVDDVVCRLRGVSHVSMFAPFLFRCL